MSSFSVNIYVLPGVGVHILILSDVHVQSPGAGHDVIVVSVVDVTISIQCWSRGG